MAKTKIAQTNVEIITIDNECNKVRKTLSFDGILKRAKAQNAVRAALGTTNFMIRSINTEITGEIEVSDAVFFDNSVACVDGETYGREYVVKTFQVQEVIFEVIDLESDNDDGETYYFERVGKLSDVRLRRYIEKEFGYNNFLILSSPVVEQRRYMPKDNFIALAEK